MRASDERDLREDLSRGLIEVIERAKDPSPIGEYPSTGNDGDADSEFRCVGALNWLAQNELSVDTIGSILDELCGPSLPSGKRLRSVVHNMAAIHAASRGLYSEALRYAERAFGYWQHDVFNHRLIIKYKNSLGNQDSKHSSSLADYLEGSYCQRPFEHFETTFDNRVYLCSPDYLTAPVADLKSIIGSDKKSKIARSEIDRVAWNTPAARYVRRSIIAGEFRSCSPLTCPMIQGRLLPQRARDDVPEDIKSEPQLIQTDYYGYSVYYFKSRVYALPSIAIPDIRHVSDGILVSYTIADLQNQLSELVDPLLRPLAPINLDWFSRYNLVQSVVLTLDPNSEQGRVKERMDLSPRELMMTHDNSCNISCPSCRTHTIIASRQETEEYDRLVPVFLGLLKDAERLIVSGSGDPFASRHFRRLLRAAAGKDIETYGEIKLPENFRINLMTNGMLLNQTSYEDFGLRGIIGIVSLSMDSCEKETFERIRRGSKWETLLQTLEFLQQIRAENPDMVLISYFTVQASNFEEIPRFIEFCRSHNFQHVQLNMVRNFGVWSREEFERENIGSPQHSRFSEFLEVLRSIDTEDKFVILGNAGDYRSLAIERAAAPNRPKGLLGRILSSQNWIFKVRFPAFKIG